MASLDDSPFLRQKISTRPGSPHYFVPAHTALNVQYVGPCGRAVKKHLAATETLEPFFWSCHRHFILSAAFRFLMAYSMSSLSP